MPEKPLKHYAYYATDPENAQALPQRLPIEAFGDKPPTPEQLEALYQAMCQQLAKQGKVVMGGVPRPTHFGVEVLHELPKPKEAPKQPVSLFLPNGRKGVA